MDKLFAAVHAMQNPVWHGHTVGEHVRDDSKIATGVTIKRSLDDAVSSSVGYPTDKFRNDWNARNPMPRYDLFRLHNGSPL
jgi:hypothetical protein